jgi:hypothetical protein
MAGGTHSCGLQVNQAEFGVVVVVKIVVRLFCCLRQIPNAPRVLLIDVPLELWHQGVR